MTYRKYRPLRMFLRLGHWTVSAGGWDAQPYRVHGGPRGRTNTRCRELKARAMRRRGKCSAP